MSSKMARNSSRGRKRISLSSAWIASSGTRTVGRLAGWPWLCRRLPSSSAALIWAARTGPIPGTAFNSSRFLSSKTRSPLVASSAPPSPASRRWQTDRADSWTVPLRIMIARSSASDKALPPRRLSFSVGRSATGIDFMVRRLELDISYSPFALQGTADHQGRR